MITQIRDSDLITKLKQDLPHFRSMARHARANKRYAEAAHLDNMADYVEILLRWNKD